LLYKTVQDLKEYVQRCITELVFNLDEVGISDWEDHETKNVVILPTPRGQMIHHGIFRNVKPISAISCVSTPGKSLVPDRITLQNFASVREQLKRDGVQLGTDFVLKSIRTVVLSNRVELHALDEFSEEMAMSLMDNSSSQIIVT
jgi:hypothetical protein